MNKIIFKGDDTKLSKYLLQCVGLTYNVIRMLLRGKEIKVNGKRVKDDVTLTFGDTITIYYDIEYRPKVVFEDENIMVIDKKKGIATTGFGGLEQCAQSAYGMVYAVHRLDTNTDGLTVFAKNEVAKDALEDAFYHRDIQKYYVGVVIGKPPKMRDTVEHYLFKIESEGKVLVSDTPKKDYLKAVTEYEVLEIREDKTLLNIILHTGRTHQIRAVFAQLGCPILGDGKYGEQNSGEAKQQLTAYKITFGFEAKSPLYYLNGKTVEIDYANRVRF